MSQYTAFFFQKALPFIIKNTLLMSSPIILPGLDDAINFLQTDVPRSDQSTVISCRSWQPPITFSGAASRS